MYKIKWTKSSKDPTNDKKKSILFSVSIIRKKHTFKVYSIYDVYDILYIKQTIFLMNLKS